MLLLLSLSIIGWVAVSVIGTQAYFRGEQTKPIHARNINSESFVRLAAVITGRGADLSEQVVSRQADT